MFFPPVFYPTLENIILYIVYFTPPLYFSVNKYICIFNNTYQLDIFNLAELTDMPMQYTKPPSASYQPMGD